MIPDIGPRNTAYPLRNARRVSAELRIFQGARPQQAIMAAMMQPRLMFTQRGKRTVGQVAHSALV